MESKVYKCYAINAILLRYERFTLAVYIDTSKSYDIEILLMYLKNHRRSMYYKRRL